MNLSESKQKNDDIESSNLKRFKNLFNKPSLKFLIIIVLLLVIGVVWLLVSANRGKDLETYYMGSAVRGNNYSNPRSRHIFKLPIPSSWLRRSRSSSAIEPAMGPGSCRSGQTRCSGNFVFTCGKDGSWQRKACANNEVCKLHDGVAECVGDVVPSPIKECSPGQTKCGDNSISICDDNGSWYSKDCPYNKICKLQNGVAECVARVISNPKPKATPNPKNEDAQVKACKGLYGMFCTQSYSADICSKVKVVCNKYLGIGDAL